MHLLTFLKMLLINIYILDTPIVSFHKYDKINPNTDLPIYLVHNLINRNIRCYYVDSTQYPKINKSHNEEK